MFLSTKLKGANHWSVGIALLGMFLYVSPSLTFLGVGISAIGVAFYAASRGRVPVYSVFSLVPVFGTLAALIVLTFLSSKDRNEADALSRAQRLIRVPAIWAAALLAVSVVVWLSQNPPATHYAMRSYNLTAKSDLKNAMSAQESYYKDNNTYADSIDKLIGKPAGLHLRKGVTVKVVSGNATYYKMLSFHGKGDNQYVATGPEGKIEEIQLKKRSRDDYR